MAVWTEKVISRPDFWARFKDKLCIITALKCQQKKTTKPSFFISLRVHRVVYLKYLTHWCISFFSRRESENEEGSGRM